MACVGFVGLGAMGAPMAANLARAGRKVVLCDARPGAARALADTFAGGAEVAGSPAELAAREDVEVVVSMLPGAAQVEEVYLGTDGLLSETERFRPKLLIDSSTTGPEMAKKLHTACQAHPKKPLVVDAPVSGGVPGAEQATLTFMVGGSETCFGGARPVLQEMGRRLVHCGANGAGQAAKLCNNLVLGISMAGVAEGLALGKQLGLDTKLLSDVLNTSSGRCWSSDTYNPCPGVMEGVPAARDYKNGFLTDLMIKDLLIARNSADHTEQPIPMGASALELYQRLSAEGHGLEDFGAIYKHFYSKKE